MTPLDIITYFSLIAYCICSTLEGETIQITDSYFRYPWALKYINASLQTVAIFIVLLWKGYRLYFNLSSNIIRRETKYNAMRWFVYYCFIEGCLTSIGGVLINISLKGNIITVPTSTAISSMKPIPILILSILYLKQKLNLWMIFAMIVALMGIICFVLEKSSSNHVINTETHDTYYGIFLTITWTFLFATQQTIEKQMIVYCFEKDKILIGSALNMFYRTMVTVILCPWMLFYPQNVNINPIPIIAWKWVLINGSIPLITHFFFMRVMALKSTLYVSIASAMQIPLAFIVDVDVHDYQFNLYAICGALFIIISFLMLEVIKPKPSNKICNYSFGIKSIPHIDTKRVLIKPTHGLLINVINENIHYGAISRIK